MALGCIFSAACAALASTDVVDADLLAASSDGAPVPASKTAVELAPPPGSYNSPVSGFFLKFDTVPSSDITACPLVLIDCVCSIVLTGALVPVDSAPVSGLSALLGVVVAGGVTIRPLLLTVAGADLLGPLDASSLAAWLAVAPDVF